MSAVAYAPIPEVTEAVDAPISNLNIAEMETPRVLFFAMDTISDAEKRDLPFKQFGGIHLPNVKLLRATKGMLYRCQMTRLPKFAMVPDWKNMLGPHPCLPQEDSFTRTVIVNGEPQQQTVKGFLESDPNADRENGEFKNKRSNHITYHKRYAGQDCALALRRTPFGHAPGGVVELTALKGASAADVSAAQLYFFPEWKKIKAGQEALPATVKETEALIKAKRADIANQLWAEDQKQKYYSIADDMLRSCSEFQRRALEAVRADERIVTDAATKGAGGQVHHSTISDQYLEQTGSRRKEDVLTGQVNDVATLTQEMREDRQAKAEAEAKRLNLEERRQYLEEVKAGFRERDEAEEIRLGMKPAKTYTENIRSENVVTETVTNGMKLCGKPTANGTCGREIDALADACWQHE